MRKQNLSETEPREALSPLASISFDVSRKAWPIIVFVIGIAIMMAQWIVGRNIVAIVGALYMCIVSALIVLGIFAKKRVYLWYTLGYIAVSFGIATYFIFNGADAGWGAFTTTHSGFATADNALWTGEGNLWTRLAGNIVICAPAFIAVVAITIVAAKCSSAAFVKGFTRVVGIALVGLSVFFVFTMNLRSNPKALDMSKGQAEYLGNIDKNAGASSPNVLYILMDDLGYGDTSYNARKAGRTPAFETPVIDSIAEQGVDFTNFYANYSVCSPSRFAAMTGRYPYRGYADNVMYPTVNSLVPFSATRVFNSIEMGNNCDGMMGDEITVAETLKAAGYATGCFGKWHLGDYGQYLPTNQGFDYFYGSHHINDNVPYYHSEEEGGEYKIAVGTEKLDQSAATKLIHDKTYDWISDKADSGTPFFAYYASPWPHAPVHAGYDFQGTSGAGIYGDCVSEFDYYLGELFGMLKEKGVFDDTIIIFTSDNGPALQGAVNELKGGKYTAYEAGQKVPFYMRWGNDERFTSNVAGQAKTVDAPAAMADIYPTLAHLCGVIDKGGTVRDGYMPDDVDRTIDGVDMTPLLSGEADFIHGKEHPILHMKREKIKAVQYSLTKAEVLASVAGYAQSDSHKVQTGNAADYANLPFIAQNDYTTWKYFRSMSNDNPAFPDKSRKNWLVCLTDDSGESYQRADMFPAIARTMNDDISYWSKNFKGNRRGAYADYYGG